MANINYLDHDRSISSATIQWKLALDKRLSELNSLISNPIYSLQVRNIITRYIASLPDGKIYLLEKALPEIRNKPGGPASVRIFIDPQNSNPGQRFCLNLPLQTPKSSKGVVVIMHIDTRHAQEPGTGIGALSLYLEEYAFVLTAPNSKNFDSRNPSTEYFGGIGNEVLAIARDINLMMGHNDENPVERIITICQGSMQVQSWIQAGVPMPPVLQMISPLAFNNTWLKSQLSYQQEAEQLRDIMEAKNNQSWSTFINYSDPKMLRRHRNDFDSNIDITSDKSAFYKAYLTILKGLKAAGVHTVVIYHELSDTTSPWGEVLLLIQQVIHSNPEVEVLLSILNAKIKIREIDAADDGNIAIAYNSHLTTLRNASLMRELMRHASTDNILMLNARDLAHLLIPSNRIMFDNILSNYTKFRLMSLSIYLSEINRRESIRKYYQLYFEHMSEILGQTKEEALASLKEEFRRLETQVHGGVWVEDMSKDIIEREFCYYFKSTIESGMWDRVIGNEDKDIIEDSVCERRNQILIEHMLVCRELTKKIKSEEKRIESWDISSFSELTREITSIISPRIFSLPQTITENASCISPQLAATQTVIK